ncbi:MAG: hypothetical protein J6L03_05340 [Bacteroidaceae bacterium]|nr:hypothetical protein [Bacteroidaceae bacterium]
MASKRLRIFAGPNGSGKSTIFAYIDKKIGCPYFVNADEINKDLTQKGVLCFDKYAVVVDKDDLVDALQQSSWIEHIKLKNELLASLNVADNRLYVDSQCVDAYFSAFVADYVRANMLNIVHQFTIETVLSDYRKLDYINLAKKLGYRIYLYFVSTKDVEINIRRVAQRVAQGGHDVPEEKIRKRYDKSLSLLFDTIKLCDRAYLFDNSGEEWVYLAEFDQDTLILHEDIIPAWLHDNLLLKMHTEV